MESPAPLPRLRATVQSSLVRALRAAMNHATDELVARLDREGWNSRQRIDEALAVLRTGRELIETRFDQLALQSWDERTRPARSAADGPSTSLESLSLQDDGEISAGILVSRVAGRSRKRMDEMEVDGLRARFAHLLGRDWFTETDYPIAPDVVFESVRKALASFTDERTVGDLLESLEPRFSSELAGVYAAVNREFLAHGVLPKINYRVVRQQGGPERVSSELVQRIIENAGLAMSAARIEQQAALDAMAGVAESVSADAESLSGGMDHFAGDWSAAPDPLAAIAGPLAALAGPLAALADPLIAGGDPLSAPAAFHPAAFPHAPVPPVLAPASIFEVEAPSGLQVPLDLSDADRWADLSTALHAETPLACSLAVSLLSDGSVFGNAAAHPMPAASDGLMQALQGLQQHSRQTPMDRQQIARAVDEVREQGSGLERVILDTLSEVFRLVYDDAELNGAIKQQLMRLQLPALRAALLDPSFFARPVHPMRRLIDRIVDLGSDPHFDPAPYAPLLRDLADVVTGVVQDFTDDLGVIARALDAVEAASAREAARARERQARLGAAAEASEKLRQARVDSLADLAIGMQGQLPEFARRFVNEVWSEVVARVRIGVAQAPFDLVQAFRVSDLLLWSIAPKSVVQVGQLASELPALIRGLNLGVAFVGLAEDSKRQFFAALMRCHGDLIAEAKRVAAQQLDFGPASTHTQFGFPGLESAEEMRESNEGARRELVDSRAQLDALAEAGAAVPLGDAVDTLGLENGCEVRVMNVSPEGRADGAGLRAAARRFRLGWINRRRGIFIFTRHPNEHWTVRREELNELVRAGRIERAVAERATTRAIDALRAI